MSKRIFERTDIFTAEERLMRLEARVSALEAAVDILSRTVDPLTMRRIRNEAAGFARGHFVVIGGGSTPADTQTDH